MMCRKPYVASDGLELPCGRCMPCRVNRRDIWTARCVLESLYHPVSSFITLSYSDHFYPADESVSVEEMQGFCKRLRSSLGPFRFLAVGEYGSRTFRAHYHALLFGLRPSHDALTKIWGKGHVWVGSVTPQSARYCAGYTVKRLIKGDERLEGRSPEFMRCSLKPGIGYPALELLEEVHYTAFGSKHLLETRDVLRQVRIDGRVYPIGRYLTKLLRRRLGLPDSDPARREVMLETNSALRLLPDARALRDRKNDAQYERLKNRERIQRYAKLSAF